MGELKIRYAPFPVAQTSAYNSALDSDLLITPFWKAVTLTRNQADSPEWRGTGAAPLLSFYRV